MKVEKKISNAFRMQELIHRDHGGCDDSECYINNQEASWGEIFKWWYCSGACCNEFANLYEQTFKKAGNH